LVDAMTLNEFAQVVDFSQKSAVPPVPRSPLFSSHTPGQHPVYVQHHRQPPYELPELSPAQHLVIIYSDIPVPLERERRLDGELQDEQTQQGDICIVPAGASHWTHWEEEHDYLLLSFDPHLFSQTAEDAIDPARVSLTPHFSKPDPLLYQLGLALKTELEIQGWNNRLYLESIAHTFAMHVLRCYCTEQSKNWQNQTGLSKAQLKQVLHHINDLLEHDLSIAELAATVQMSPNYFAGLFKQSTGLSPHQYVTQRRIETAKQLLANLNLPLIEIAQQVGFSNQSHFSTVFRKHVGLTPKSFRQAI
jgi:AraC family transcriptional regulator